MSRNRLSQLTGLFDGKEPPSASSSPASQEHEKRQNTSKAREKVVICAGCANPVKVTASAANRASNSTPSSTSSATSDTSGGLSFRRAGGAFFHEDCFKCNRCRVVCRLPEGVAEAGLPGSLVASFENRPFHQQCLLQLALEKESDNASKRTNFNVDLAREAVAKCADASEGSSGVVKKLPPRGGKTRAMLSLASMQQLQQAPNDSAGVESSMASLPSAQSSLTTVSLSGSFASAAPSTPPSLPSAPLPGTPLEAARAKSRNSVSGSILVVTVPELELRLSLPVETGLTGRELTKRVFAKLHGWPVDRVRSQYTLVADKSSAPSATQRPLNRKTGRMKVDAMLDMGEHASRFGRPLALDKLVTGASCSLLWVKAVACDVDARVKSIKGARGGVKNDLRSRRKVRLTVGTDMFSPLKVFDFAGSDVRKDPKHELLLDSCKCTVSLDAIATSKPLEHSIQLRRRDGAWALDILVDTPNEYVQFTDCLRSHGVVCERALDDAATLCVPKKKRGRFVKQPLQSGLEGTLSASKTPGTVSQRRRASRSKSFRSDSLEQLMVESSNAPVIKIENGFSRGAVGANLLRALDTIKTSGEYFAATKSESSAQPANTLRRARSRSRLVLPGAMAVAEKPSSHDNRKCRSAGRGHGQRVRKIANVEDTEGAAAAFVKKLASEEVVDESMVAYFAKRFLPFSRGNADVVMLREATLHALATARDVDGRAAVFTELCALAVSQSRLSLEAISSLFSHLIGSSWTDAVGVLFAQKSLSQEDPFLCVLASSMPSCATERMQLDAPEISLSSISKTARRGILGEARSRAWKKQDESISGMISTIFAKMPPDVRHSLVADKCADGGNILHVACRSGLPQLVGVLLREGADLTVKTYKGETPLACALLRGDYERPPPYALCQLLMQSGAVVDDFARGLAAQLEDARLRGIFSLSSTVSKPTFVGSVFSMGEAGSSPFRSTLSRSMLDIRSEMVSCQGPITKQASFGSLPSSPREFQRKGSVASFEIDSQQSSVQLEIDESRSVESSERPFETSSSTSHISIVSVGSKLANAVSAEISALVDRPRIDQSVATVKKPHTSATSILTADRIAQSETIFAAWKKVPGDRPMLSEPIPEAPPAPPAEHKLPAKLSSVASSEEVDYAELFGLDVIEPGAFEIWIIDGKFPELLDHKAHGVFFSRDCYIVLDYDEVTPYIHIWHGSAASVDKKAISAIRGVELNRFMRDVATIQRHDCGDESEDFVIMFGDEYEIRPGGSENTFRNYSNEPIASSTGPEPFPTPRLYCMQQILEVTSEGGKQPADRRVRVWQTEPIADALTDQDVFILDCGSKIFVWRVESNGQGNSVSSWPALQLAQRLNQFERHARAEVIEVVQRPSQTSLDSEELEDFWLMLQTTEASGMLAIEHVRSEFDPRIRFISVEVDVEGAPVVDATELGSEDQVGSESQSYSLTRSMLDGGKCIIIDFFWEVFVWLGAKATRKSKVLARKLASALVAQDDARDPWITESSPRVELQHYESPLFRAKFDDWNGRMPINATATTTMTLDCDVDIEHARSIQRSLVARESGTNPLHDELHGRIAPSRTAQQKVLSKAAIEAALEVYSSRSETKAMLQFPHSSASTDVFVLENLVGPKFGKLLQQENYDELGVFHSSTAYTVLKRQADAGEGDAIDYTAYFWEPATSTSTGLTDPGSKFRNLYSSWIMGFVPTLKKTIQHSERGLGQLVDKIQVRMFSEPLSFCALFEGVLWYERKDRTADPNLEGSISHPRTLAEIRVDDTMQIELRNGISVPVVRIMPTEPCSCHMSQSASFVLCIDSHDAMSTRCILWHGSRTTDIQRTRAEEICSSTHKELLVQQMFSEPARSRLLACAENFNLEIVRTDTFYSLLHGCSRHPHGAPMPLPVDATYTVLLCMSHCGPTFDLEVISPSTGVGDCAARNYESRAFYTQEDVFSRDASVFFLIVDAEIFVYFGPNSSADLRSAAESAAAALSESLAQSGHSRNLSPLISVPSENNSEADVRIRNRFFSYFGFWTDTDSIRELRQKFAAYNEQVHASVRDQRSLLISQRRSYLEHAGIYVGVTRPHVDPSAHAVELEEYSSDPRNALRQVHAKDGGSNSLEPIQLPVRSLTRCCDQHPQLLASWALGSSFCCYRCAHSLPAAAATLKAHQLRILDSANEIASRLSLVTVTGDTTMISRQRVVAMPPDNGFHPATVSFCADLKSCPNCPSKLGCFAAGSHGSENLFCFACAREHVQIGEQIGQEKTEPLDVVRNDVQADTLAIKPSLETDLHENWLPSCSPMYDTDRLLPYHDIDPEQLLPPSDRELTWAEALFFEHFEQKRLESMSDYERQEYARQQELERKAEYERQQASLASWLAEIPWVLADDDLRPVAELPYFWSADYDIQGLYQLLAGQYPGTFVMFPSLAHRENVGFAMVGQDGTLSAADIQRVHEGWVVDNSFFSSIPQLVRQYVEAGWFTAAMLAPEGVEPVHAQDDDREHAVSLDIPDVLDDMHFSHESNPDVSTQEVVTQERTYSQAVSRCNSQDIFPDLGIPDVLDHLEHFHITSGAESAADGRLTSEVAPIPFSSSCEDVSRLPVRSVNGSCPNHATLLAAWRSIAGQPVCLQCATTSQLPSEHRVGALMLRQEAILGDIGDLIARADTLANQSANHSLSRTIDEDSTTLLSVEQLVPSYAAVLPVRDCLSPCRCRRGLLVALRLGFGPLRDVCYRCAIEAATKDVGVQVRSSRNTGATPIVPAPRPVAKSSTDRIVPRTREANLNGSKSKAERISSVPDDGVISTQPPTDIVTTASNVFSEREKTDGDNVERDDDFASLRATAQAEQKERISSKDARSKTGTSSGTRRFASMPRVSYRSVGPSEPKSLTSEAEPVVDRLSTSAAQCDLDGEEQADSADDEFCDFAALRAAARAEKDARNATVLAPSHPPSMAGIRRFASLPRMSYKQVRDARAAAAAELAFSSLPASASVGNNAQVSASSAEDEEMGEAAPLRVAHAERTEGDVQAAAAAAVRTEDPVSSPSSEDETVEDFASLRAAAHAERAERKASGDANTSSTPSRRGVRRFASLPRVSYKQVQESKKQ